MLETLQDNYIFAVVRGTDAQDAFNISVGAVEGGIKNIEVTYTTPNATQVIKDLVAKYQDREDVIIGAGTIMNTELAEEAIAAGAAFIVSPHFDPVIQAVAQTHDNYYFPGCATATEIVQAMTVGCEIIKAFPGGILGPGFIKDIHGPIPEVKIMPSGGVSLDNITQWQAAGAVSVGVGSALSANVATDGYESVTAMAQQFVSALES